MGKDAERIVHIYVGLLCLISISFYITSSVIEAEKENA